MKKNNSDANWQEFAECIHSSSKLFFPPMEFERSVERRKREIKAGTICKACVVSDQCLSYAMSHKELTGFWGGTNEKERQQRRVLLEIYG